MDQPVTAGRPLTDLIDKPVLVRHDSYGVRSFYFGVLTKIDSGGITLRGLKRIVPEGRQIVTTEIASSVRYWLYDVAAEGDKTDRFPFYNVTALREVLEKTGGDLDRKVTEMILED